MLAPELRIGSENAADYSLSNVAHLTVHPRTGAVYIAQPQEGLIRVYDAQGRFVRTIGRKGSGPGEFQGVYRLGWRADTLYAPDTRLPRISLFSAQGKHLGTLGAAGVSLGQHFPNVYPVGLLANGSVVARSNLSAGLMVNGVVTSVPVAEVSREGRLRGHLPSLRARDTQGAIRGANSITFFKQPFPDQSAFALAPDGSSVVVVHAPPAEDRAAARFQVIRLRSASDTVYSRSYRYTPQPVPREVVDSIVEERLHELIGRGMSRPAAEKAVRDALKIPAYLPPLRAVLLGQDGRVWLQQTGPGGGPARWLVLDPTGGIIAEAAVPDGAQLLEVHNDVAWGVELDELDIPYVVRYRIRVTSR
jgi:hypothetical protein